MSETVTTEQVIAELRAMVEYSRDHPGILQRTFKTSLTVLYEFVEGDALRPYTFTLDQDRGELVAGARDYADCDVAIRITPEALHLMLTGALGGREAMSSGRLDIRKAPAMPKLLMMRGMFNRYRKSLHGQTPAALQRPPAAPDEAALPDAETTIPLISVPQRQG